MLTPPGRSGRRCPTKTQRRDPVKGEDSVETGYTRPRSGRQSRSGGGAMTAIANVQADHYLIKLPVVLSDSTHGQITHFELVTVRLRDAEGHEGAGYTYTVGANGAAVHATIQRDLRSDERRV